MLRNSLARCRVTSYFLVGSLFLLSLACATSPLGRKQLMLLPDAQVDQMGVEAFQELQAKETIDKNPGNSRYVHCIVDPLTLSAKIKNYGDKLPATWEVVVFKSNSVNAFALPGGKIGVFTELLKVAKTDSQLAAVLGHEIGHVIAHHGAERLSQQAGTQFGMAALGHITRNNPHRDMLLGLLGVGAQVGILLPYSRTQESEADLIGLDLMATAGFDPRESVELWKNMMAAGGKAPPEVLSTHPASESRIEALQKHMPEALSLFEKAQAQGQKRSCDRSGMTL
ncbi:MAG: M48 family metallopeptidase [Bdellovibrionia bacterium]